MTSQEVYDILMSIDNGYIATKDEMEILNSKNEIKWSGISSLPKCMELLKSLKILRLSNTRITDISFLSGLTTLTYLDLSFTEVSDISTLLKLESLTDLNLSGTKVIDISTLSGLSSLVTLNLSVNRINDISALSKLTCLNYL